jgi:hypothetical protein
MIEGGPPVSDDPKQLVYAAINAERRENPDCPVASMMEDLLVMYRAGDEGALRLAIDIAKDTLAPRRPNIFLRLKSRLLSTLDKRHKTE